MTKLEKKQIVEASLRLLPERLAAARLKNKKHSLECSKYNKLVTKGLLKPRAGSRIKRSDDSIL